MSGRTGPSLATDPRRGTRRKMSAPRRRASAQALRACLAQLMQEALDHDFRLSALHIRVAMLELEDVLAQAGRGAGGQDRLP